MGYAGDVKLVSEGSNKLRVSLDRLNDTVCYSYRISKMLHDWTSLMPNSILDGSELTNIDCFGFPGSCVTKDGGTAVEVNADVSKARAAYNGLKHF